MKVITLLILVTILASCSSRYYTKKANYEYEDLNFGKSSQLYEKALLKKYSRDNSLKMAESYYRKGDFQKALDAVSMIVQNDSIEEKPDLMIARIFMANEKYEQAKKQLQLLSHSGPDSSLIKSYIEAINSINELKDKNPSVVKLLDLNSEMAVFAPYVYDKKLFFTGIGSSDKKTDDWSGETFSDIFIAELKNDSIVEDVKSLSINDKNKYHMATVCFLDKGNKAFFSSSAPLTKALFLREQKGEIINIGIFQSQKGEDKWDSITKLPFVKPEYSFMHPSVDSDNKILFFASDMPGGFGGFDIYYCKYNNGHWSKPINAGQEINTSTNELFPFIDNQNNLFFASEGHQNIGGLDIFKSKFTDNNEFTTAVNVGIPLNSSKDDFGVWADKNEIMYFSSNRQGRDNIYFNKAVAPVISNPMIAFVEIQVMDENNNPIVNAEIVLSEDSSIYTDSNGLVRSANLLLDTQYVFTPKKENYTGKPYLVDVPKKLTEDTTVFIVNIMMYGIAAPPIADIRTPEMVKLEIEKIYYDFDKYNIRGDAYKSLVKIADYMVKNPDVTIELMSHTDSRGNNAYNMVLSKRRSISVVSTLVSLGVNVDNIKAFYIGENMLEKDCGVGVKCSESLHQLNRRTVFTLNNELSKMLETNHQIKSVDLLAIDLGRYKSSTNKNSSYEVIAGSFSYYNNAKNSLNEYKNMGFINAKISISENKQHYRIIIESFSTNKEALEFMKTLIKKYHEMDLWLHVK